MVTSIITSATSPTMNARVALDRLFLCDAVSSMTIGIVGIIVPHIVLLHFLTEYSHHVHEVVRLYASLRLAVGWMLWNVRLVDDGVLRRRICEGLLACNVLQSLIVLRAIVTVVDEPSSRSKNNIVNWSMFIILTLWAIGYGRFRFGHGGHLIKIYELPTSAVLR